jgi:hypothetical protein
LAAAKVWERERERERERESKLKRGSAWRVQPETTPTGTLADGGRYAASVGAVHCNTSAKLNRGIEELFFDLTKRASP